MSRAVERPQRLPLTLFFVGYNVRGENVVAIFSIEHLEYWSFYQITSRDVICRNRALHARATDSRQAANLKGILIVTLGGFAKKACYTMSRFLRNALKNRLFECNTFDMLQDEDGTEFRFVTCQNRF